MTRRGSKSPARALSSICIGAATITIAAAAASAQWRSVWRTQIDTGNNMTEVDFDVEIDSGGNAITVGYVSNPGTGDDLLIRKYDRTGRLLWTQMYDGGGSGDEFSADVIIDAGDNIYATGTGVNSSGNTDIVTLKYDPSGNLQWAAHYDGPLGGRDESYGWPAIGLDDNGNIYVGGYSQALDGVYEFAAVKYDSAGNELWARHYRGPNPQRPNSYGYSIAVTGDGNVYMSGSVANLNDNSDYAVIKYDTDGNVLWERLFDGQYGGDDSLYTITVDDSESVFASGISDSQYLNGDFEYCTASYDADGNFRWEARYGGSFGFHYGWVSAPDGAGGAYVSGASMTTGGEYDMVTVHYDANGNLAWAQRYRNPIWFGDDWAYMLRLDGDGNVLVAGYGWNGIGEGDNAYLVKYSPTGNLLEEVNYDSPVHGQDRFYSVAVDDAGRVVTTGFSLGAQTGADTLVAKYTTAPAPELTLNPDPLIAGQSALFTVTDMEPDSDCYLGYSLQGSSNLYVPFLNVTLELQNPQQAGGVRVSDAGGTVQWQLPIPNNASGMTVWFQAAQYNQVSNVVANQIQ